MPLRLAGVLAAALVTVCAPAGAAVRSGASTDAVGDNVGPPSQDIVSARATYDTAGVLTVSATMNDDLAKSSGTHFSFDVATRAHSVGCYMDPTFTMVFGLFGEERAVGFISAAADLYDFPLEVTGATMTGTWRAPELADRGYGCIALTLGRSVGDDDYLFFDRLEPPIVFPGVGDAAPRAPRRLPAACDERLGRARALCVKRTLARARCAKRKPARRRAACRRRADRLRL